MFRLPISAADAIWGWEIYPPIEICLCAKVSHIIYYTYINHVNGEGCYGVLASVNTMVASSLVSRVTRIRGLPDFLKMCPYANVFTIFVESEDYQMNVDMNILNIWIYWLAMAKNYQTEEMSLWWAWVPLKDFLLFYPFSPAIGIYFLSLNRSSHWNIPFPFCP